MRYYLDTSILIDYYENRSDKFRPIGEWAVALLNIIIEYKWVVYISDIIFKELNEYYGKEEIERIIFPLKNKRLLKYINYTKKQIQEAINISKSRKLPFGDALHAVLARDNEAILVSRDKHFLELLDIVEVKKPEDLI